MQCFLTVTANFFLFGLTGCRICRNHFALPHIKSANGVLFVGSCVNTC
jgi:hypothetical protein